LAKRLQSSAKSPTTSEQTASNEPPFSNEANIPENQQRRAGKPRPTEFYSWEGIRDDVPERYQRWESIRERNVILSLVLGLLGHGRKQPTSRERIHLLLLYASVWYLSYAFALKYRGEGCRKGWAQTCVPQQLGGGCSSQCARQEVLQQTPQSFAKYEKVLKVAAVTVNVHDALCVINGNFSSPCEIPMCAPRGQKTCISDRRGASGMCKCQPNSLVFEVVLYTVLFKLLYMPYWYLFVFDLQEFGSWCAWIVARSAMALYLMLFLAGFVMQVQYFHSFGGVVLETIYWLMSFCVICCFEVVKAFTLGFLVGSYVLRPMCGGLPAGVWKFFLS